MALVKCPECGAAVSSLATSCPKCGSPIDGANLQPITSVPSTPSVSVPITISWKALLNGFMMVLGLTALILISISYNNRNNYEALTLHQAASGFMMSTLALFFLIMAVKKNSTEYERILGWFGSGLSLLLIIFDLHFHFGWYTTALTAVIGLIIVAYAFTVQDYSKYIAFATGVLMVASGAFEPWAIEYHGFLTSGNEMIALGSVAGIGYIVLMGYWSAVAYAAQNKPATRFLAGVQAALMLTTVIIGAVCFKKCLNGNVGSMQLVLVFAILSGMTGLLLAFFAKPNKTLCILSVLCGLAMLFILLRIYPEIYYNAVNYDYSYNYYDSYDYSYSDNAALGYERLKYHSMNLTYAALFMLPFFIMFTYLARMTGNLRNRLSIQVNIRS